MVTTRKKPTKSTRTPVAATKPKTSTVKAKKTTSRAVAPKRTALEPAKPAVSKAKEQTGGASMVRKKELIGAVVARSGVKKRDAKPVVEALLAELATALAKGRGLNLPPLGRVKINRTREMENGRVIIVKMRQKDNAAPETGVKEAAE